ncbi:GNAT family N-acetyltransferase [Bacillus sp. JJ664]
MTIHLESVTRDNWEKALNLTVNKEQSNFVPSVSVSLAKIYIKPDGEHVEYIPFTIYHDEELVGFIMFAYEEDSTNMYWINGFIIDSMFQGNGFGRAALQEIVKWISDKFSICEEIRLTVHKDNLLAKNLYKNFGFIPNGDEYHDEEVWVYNN